jgi:serine/threonine protein kinase
MASKNPVIKIFQTNQHGEDIQIAPPVIINRSIGILSRLEQACLGKYDRQGGMDLEELREIVKARGIDASTMRRSEVINLLCKSEQIPKTALVEYYQPDEFYARYPKDKILGQGSYGIVYVSGDNVVKVQKFRRGSLEYPAVLELNMLASIYHPCIIRPSAWTCDDTSLSMVMPMGEQLSVALAHNEITIEEIISDTMSAVSYLNSLGIVHGDIKPLNMVFHEGKAKLIDFGLAQYATLLPDGKYYINDVAYTEAYRDPEYSVGQWNSINAEIYALAKTYHDLELQGTPKIENAYSFSSPTSHVDWLFTEAKLLQNQRKSIDTLISSAPQKLIVRKYTGVELDTPVIPYNKDCGQKFIRTMHWMVKISDMFRFKAKTLFSALHLVHRTVTKITTSQLQCFGCMCLNLAYMVCEVNDMILDDWHYATKDKYTNSEFQAMMITILEASHGIINSVNYWDYASCAEDLLGMLDDIISCDYDPLHVRKLLHTGSSKDITVDELITTWNDALLQKNMELIRQYPEDAKLLPVVIKPKEGVTFIMNKWGNALTQFTRRSRVHVEFEMVSVLLHNRHMLNKLPRGVIEDIYRILKLYGSDYDEIVDKLRMS